MLNVIPLINMTLIASPDKITVFDKDKFDAALKEFGFDARSIRNADERPALSRKLYTRSMASYLLIKTGFI